MCESGGHRCAPIDFVGPETLLLGGFANFVLMKLRHGPSGWRTAAVQSTTSPRNPAKIHSRWDDPQLAPSTVAVRKFREFGDFGRPMCEPGGHRCAPIDFVGSETLLLEGFTNFVLMKLRHEPSGWRTNSHTIDNKSEKSRQNPLEVG